MTTFKFNFECTVSDKTVQEFFSFASDSLLESSTTKTQRKLYTNVGTCPLIRENVTCPYRRNQKISPCNPNFSSYITPHTAPTSPIPVYHCDKYGDLMESPKDEFVELAELFKTAMIIVLDDPIPLFEYISGNINPVHMPVLYACVEYLLQVFDKSGKMEAKFNTLTDSLTPEYRKQYTDIKKLIEHLDRRFFPSICTRVCENTKGTTEVDKEQDCLSPPTSPDLTSDEVEAVGNYPLNVDELLQQSFRMVNKCTKEDGSLDFSKIDITDMANLVSFFNIGLPERTVEDPTDSSVDI